MKNLTDVYREALRLHKLSWTKAYAPFIGREFKLKDTDHLPKEMYDMDYIDNLDRKIAAHCVPENLFKSSLMNVWSITNNNVFKCKLTAKECLILLLKADYDNINYKGKLDIDLDNYKLGAETYKIEIIK